MPTYEFRCPDGHDFEKFYRSISGAEAKAACPHCGQPAERVMSATGFAFKGSGFYLTDYGKNAHREKGASEPGSGAPAGEAAGSGESASEPKAESSGESKSESSGESKNESKGESKSGSKSESKNESKREAGRESKGDSKQEGSPAASKNASPSAHSKKGEVKSADSKPAAAPAKKSSSE